MPELSGYAKVNGLRMYYERHGDGLPLVLLHGRTCTIDRDHIALFSHRFDVIAPEQMGHGHAADDPTRVFHCHDTAEDTVELMSQLKIEQALVVGFSDGGILGLDVAMHHPERVSKLVVSGTNFSTDGIAGDQDSATAEHSVACSGPSRTRSSASSRTRATV